MGERDSNAKRILIILLVLNLVLIGIVLTVEIAEKINERNLHDQYTLYIGTNDKDTNVQELSLDECRMRVESICMQHVSGYTITEADGGWTDDAGNIVHEKSLICYISGATADQIDAIVEQLLSSLNQSSIMVEHQRLNVTYRSHG